MAIFKGENINIEIYGSSHSEKIGAKVSGFPRLKIDGEGLKEFLKRRSPNDEIYSTKRREEDEPVFEKMSSNGVIDGDFEVNIYNKDVKSEDYNDLYAKPRPSHADYGRYLKDGVKDFRGGGEFSGRLTAPFCVVGYLAKQYLQDRYGVKISAYLSSVGKINGKSYKDGEITESEIERNEGFPSLSKGNEMIEEIARASQDGDSVGATAECIAFRLPLGVGGSLFDGLEGKISYLLYSIPGVKGVEFGDGFEISRRYGSEANDQLKVEDGKVKIITNFSGGINGGISNGNPMTLRVAFRPTPSIAKEQTTVDLEKNQTTAIRIKGRHDSCFAVRALPAVESAVAIALLDCVLGEKGYEND